MLQKEMPMLPKLQLAISDVRDVATAHIKSLTLPNVPGLYKYFLTFSQVQQLVCSSVGDLEFYLEIHLLKS